ncbi:phage major capsid protein [Arsenophonus nasoniae]|uniref:Phage major capsid protein n=1 Tax=Arsenophonus nasoniae TaxID=638 RepID=A0AA95GWM2_9GAMM|nr:phage major capsid protein [Arsenophonus nasoniae]WGM04035.1 phage major capsid protein [Arsenophonus nasoniae]
MQKAFGIMHIKSIDEDLREIVGIATSATPDKHNDIVEPEGAVFNLPIPLLWQHDKHQPIGEVVEAELCDEGIRVKAKITKIANDDNSITKRLNDAWTYIKTGLVKGLSIGFSPIKYESIDNGGCKFLKWAWNELSVVTVPANTEATIQLVKSLHKTNIKTIGAPKSVNIFEEIKSLKASRSEKSNMLESIITITKNEERKFNEEEKRQFDALSTEVSDIDEELVRLNRLVEIKKTEAEPIQPMTRTPQKTKASLPKTTFSSEKEKGMQFARYVKCLAASQGNLMQACEIAKSSYANNHDLQTVLKAAVSAGSTLNPAWAGNLVEYQLFTGDFIEFLRPQTIIGKFGVSGIPALRKVPFNVRINAQTAGSSGYWVGEGKPTPLTTAGFDTVKLGFAKVANIAVLTDELAQYSDPSAELLIRDSLAKALIERIDKDFIDPFKAEILNISPASITNPAKGEKSSGDPDKDIATLIGKFTKANITLNNAVWIMSSMTALSLSLLRAPTGQFMYDRLGLTGGTFHGFPVITSEYVGNLLILVKPEEIYLADDGNVLIGASRDTSLEMSDTPSEGGSPQLVSMFQTNSIAIRAERQINWKLRRPEAVAYLTDVDYSKFKPTFFSIETKPAKNNN